MLTLLQTKKILGDKAKNYTDERIEAIRDELYVAANLAFEHWRKNCSSTKPGEASPVAVGEQAPASAL